MHVDIFQKDLKKTFYFLSFIMEEADESDSRHPRVRGAPWLSK